MEEKLRQKTDDLKKKAVKLSNKKRRATQESSKCEKVMKMEPVKNMIQRPTRKKLLAKLRESGEAQSTQNFAVGQSVEVFWNEKDLEGTNWEPGWYKRVIQHFHEENGAICTFYFNDRAVYSLHASGALGWDHSFNSSSSEETGIENF